MTVPEYLLVTQPTLSSVEGADGQLVSFANGSDAYDNLGTIEYQVKSLEGYKDEVKVDPPLPAGLKNPRKMAQVTRRIDAPIERVYQRLIDLPGRLNWIEGATKVEMSNDQPNQIGKTHRCVRGDEGVELMTTEVKVSDTTMELWETDLKKIMACRYLLTRVPGGKADRRGRVLRARQPDRSDDVQGPDGEEIEVVFRKIDRQSREVMRGGWIKLGETQMCERPESFSGLSFLPRAASARHVTPIALLVLKVHLDRRRASFASLPCAGTFRIRKLPGAADQVHGAFTDRVGIATLGDGR